MTELECGKHYEGLKINDYMVEKDKGNDILY